jgi:hypothetical protein
VCIWQKKQKKAKQLKNQEMRPRPRQKNQKYVSFAKKEEKGVNEF